MNKSVVPPHGTKFSAKTSLNIAQQIRSAPVRFLLAMLAMLPVFLLPATSVIAQSTETAPSAHAIEQFGKPPAIPEGSPIA